MQRFECLGLEYPTGCIIAKATLSDCVYVDEDYRSQLSKENYFVYSGTIEARDWNGYGFKLDNVEKIDPISTNGKLSLWEFEL